MKIKNSKKLEKVLESLLQTNATELDEELMKKMVSKPLLTNGDFVSVFGIDHKTAYRWRQSDVINYIKVSTRVYYHWKDVILLLSTKQSTKAL